MSTPVARPVQYEQEGHDADGHALASDFVGSNRTRLHHEKGKPYNEKSEKSSHKSEKGKKRPGTSSTVRVPKKVHYEKHCNLCKKHGGAHTTQSTGECCKYKKDGTEKSSFRATKKRGKKKYPVNQNFAQLTKKVDKLEKALKKSGKKGKKCRYEDSDSNSK